MYIHPLHLWLLQSKAEVPITSGITAWELYTMVLLCLRSRSRATAVSLGRGGSREDLAGDDQTTVLSCSTARASSSLARRHASSTAGGGITSQVA